MAIRNAQYNVLFYLCSYQTYLQLQFWFGFRMQFQFCRVSSLIVLKVLTDYQFLKTIHLFHSLVLGSWSRCSCGPLILTTPEHCCYYFRDSTSSLLLGTYYGQIYFLTKDVLKDGGIHFIYKDSMILINNEQNKIISFISSHLNCPKCCCLLFNKLQQSNLALVSIWTFLDAKL